jgi:hypothetical protein
MPSCHRFHAAFDHLAPLHTDVVLYDGGVQDLADVVVDSDLHFTSLDEGQGDFSSAQF